MGSHEIRHAFFSEKQKESILARKQLQLEIKHTNIYLTTDGREVEVTEVCKDPDSYNKNYYTDFVYLGQVTKWVRLKYY